MAAVVGENPGGLVRGAEEGGSEWCVVLIMWNAEFSFLFTGLWIVNRKSRVNGGGSGGGGSEEIENEFKSSESENSSGVLDTEERNEVWWVQEHLLNLIYKPGELHLLIFFCLQTRLTWAYLNCKNSRFFPCPLILLVRRRTKML